MKPNRLSRPAVALMLGLGAAALAGPSSAADTLLFLGETATVMTSPDELQAMMRADITAPSPTDAQNRANALMRDALAAAKAVPAVIASTGGYQVWRVPPAPPDRTEKWQASQSLRLSSHDGAALLNLVGALQQKGMIVGQLQWLLSRETETRARKEATRQALAALQGRGEEAAAILGMKFDHFRSVRLDGVEPMPVPAPRAMAVARAMEVTPPTAVAEDIPVTASAQAEAILVPR